MQGMTLCRFKYTCRNRGLTRPLKPKIWGSKVQRKNEKMSENQDSLISIILTSNDVFRSLITGSERKNVKNPENRRLSPLKEVFRPEFSQLGALSNKRAVEQANIGRFR